MYTFVRIGKIMNFHVINYYIHSKRYIDENKDQIKIRCLVNFSIKTHFNTNLLKNNNGYFFCKFAALYYRNRESYL